MAEQEEKKDVYIIPPNFIDTGSLFGGLVKLRNAVEAGIIVAAITIPIMKMPITLTTRIIILCVTALPAGLLALIGIGGESISSFIINFFLFLKNRRILSRPEINVSNYLDKKNKAVMQEDFPEEFIENKVRKNGDTNKKSKGKKSKVNSLYEYLPIDKIQNGIIYTTDKRFLKVVEIDPINFMLRSAGEQRNIIYSFISFLKISPVKVQFKVLSKKAEINKQLDKVREEITLERNENRRILLNSYANLIQRIGAKDAITRRFFIIFEYEPIVGNKKNNESDAVSQLEVMARTVKNYLFQCGNKAIEHENEDEFLNEVLYLLLNRKLDGKKRLSDRVVEVMGKYIAEGDSVGINHIPASEFISPEYIDLRHGRYLIINGTYYAFMMIPSSGYKTRVTAGWLSLLINAGEGIDVDLFLWRQPRDRIQQKLGQQIRINKSKIKDASDTNTDYDDLDDAISSGYFLKNGISNNQDFYFMNILITITADSLEELEWRQNEMRKLMVSQDLNIRNCNFRQEQAFLSALPLLKLDSSLFQRSKRNVLTTGAASCYPFVSFEISDENGILLGMNKYNNSLIFLNIFNSAVYKNANISLLGATGVGKTFISQILAIRMCLILHVKTFMIAPIKGHEFRRACDFIGGSYIKFSATSKYRINMMEIRKTDDTANILLDGESVIQSKMAAKIQKLHIIFSVMVPDMDFEELQCLDNAVIKAYAIKGITHDNESLIDNSKPDQYKEMPILEDVYNALKNTKNPIAVRLADKIDYFVHGSGNILNAQTNVDLDNLYIVMDISGVLNDTLSVLVTLVTLLFVCEEYEVDRTVEKAVYIGEIWKLIGSNTNRTVAGYVLEMFKTIRGYGGGAIADTQDISDFFALDEGKYGEGILNACQTKIILNLEEKEARRVKSVLNLSETEILNITHFNRGSGLISTNHNNVAVEFIATELEKELITTDRYELRELIRKKTEHK